MKFMDDVAGAWTGTTSLEAGVKLVAQRWDQADSEPVGAATAYLVFVGVDADGKPRPVRPVLPETQEDIRRWREAEIRRAHRLARREAIQASREAGAARQASASRDTGAPSATGGPAVP